MLAFLSLELLAILVVFAYKSIRASTRISLKPGYFTYIVVPLVAIPSLLQLPFPQIFDWLSRQPSLAISSHEYWRFITPIFVQDGGLIGTAFNLIVLTLFALLADRVWGLKKSLLIFFGGGILFEAIGIIFNSSGGGNSGATFILAMSMVGACLLQKTPKSARIFGILAVIDGVILSAMRDAHGYAILFGFLLGVLLRDHSDLKFPRSKRS